MKNVSPQGRVKAMKAEELVNELIDKSEQTRVAYARHDEYAAERDMLRAELLSRLSRVEELQGQVADVSGKLPSCNTLCNA